MLSAIEPPYAAPVGILRDALFSFGAEGVVMWEARGEEAVERWPDCRRCCRATRCPRGLWLVARPEDPWQDIHSTYSVTGMCGSCGNAGAEQEQGLGECEKF